jgi:hypothetical protein
VTDLRRFRRLCTFFREVDLERPDDLVAGGPERDNARDHRGDARGDCPGGWVVVVTAARSHSEQSGLPHET